MDKFDELHILDLKIRRITFFQYFTHSTNYKFDEIQIRRITNLVKKFDELHTTPFFIQTQVMLSGDLIQAC